MEVGVIILYVSVISLDFPLPVSFSVDVSSSDAAVELFMLCILSDMICIGVLAGKNGIACPIVTASEEFSV